MYIYLKHYFILTQCYFTKLLFLNTPVIQYLVDFLLLNKFEEFGTNFNDDLVENLVMIRSCFLRNLFSSCNSKHFGIHTNSRVN